MMATEMPAAPRGSGIGCFWVKRTSLGGQNRLTRSKMTPSRYVPDPIGIVSFAPPQIVFRRHSQMLDKEPHCWASAAVFQHDDRDRPWFRG